MENAVAKKKRDGCLQFSLVN